MSVDATVRPDQVTIGVLVDSVPRDAVDEAVAICGECRSDGKRPADTLPYHLDGIAKMLNPERKEQTLPTSGQTRHTEQLHTASRNQVNPPAPTTPTHRPSTSTPSEQEPPDEPIYATWHWAYTCDVDK